MILNTEGLIWLIMGFICFVLEMALPGFIVIFFGIGAWITALACWFLPISVNQQLAIFLIVSLITLLTLRRFIQRRFSGDDSAETDGVSVVVGESVIVLEDIEPPKEGKIRYSGTQWRAIADEPVAKDSPAVIVAQEGSIIRVKRSENV